MVVERTPKGKDLYMEIEEFGVINGEKIEGSKVALAYGQMNEPSGAHVRVGLTTTVSVQNMARVVSLHISPCIQ